MAVELTLVPGLTGELARADAMSGVATLHNLAGSLAAVPGLTGELARVAGLSGEFTEFWRPPDFPAGAVQVGDLGSWRPRIRGVLGEGEPFYAWKLLGWSLFGADGLAAPKRAAFEVTRDRAIPHRYFPGSERPEDASGYTIDTIRVTDALAVYRDVFVWFHADLVPGSQALTAQIGADGVAGLCAGEELVLTGAGGTGPYVWDLTVNRSGATVTPEGVYVAGQHVGIDRLRVTDALGAVGYVQAEVLEGAAGADMVVLPEDVPDDYRHNLTGFRCIPYALVWGEGGTGPYTVAMQDNQTGARLAPPHELPAAGASTRARMWFQEADGSPVDLARWNVVARPRRADGVYAGAAELFPEWDGSIEIVLPHPADLELWESHLVLELTMTPADGGEAVVLEALFESPSESAYAAAQ